MNFNKHFNEYDNYSFVQKKVAIKLLEYIEKTKITEEKELSIFEIGCGTGIFTREYKEKFSNIKNLILNDKFDSRQFLSNINYKEFLLGDVTEIEIPQSDLVLSSSVFQWIEDIDLLFKNIALKSNKLYFSIYTFGNLIEIKNHFGISLNYKKFEEIEKSAKKFFKTVKAYKETIKLNFESPIDVLKHLKYTGVTGIQKPSVKNIRTFKDKELTYEVAYFICEN